MRSRLLMMLFGAIALGSIYAFSIYEPNPIKPEECVFNTVFGEIEMDDNIKPESFAAIKASIDRGLTWILDAQHANGGWGAGSHRNQREMDPHKVSADPATTAMVAMALLRSGKSNTNGKLKAALDKANNFLLNAMEQAAPNEAITHLEGTQIQRKLGQNIDLVLTTQHLSNFLETLDKQSEEYTRVFNALNKGVDMVQYAMDDQGRSNGAGWAGVLQSAYAANALESAQSQGVSVDGIRLKKAKEYQSKNYNPVSEKVETKDGAGIMLYSVSGSFRANAQSSRKAKETIKKAYKNKEIDEVVVSYENLRKAGLSEEEALELDTANKIYDSAKTVAQDREVMNGFGNNGGEEFMSFLQTGESLIINDDKEWKNWYDSMSATLTGIQNNDGSWNGHHCITSPVFCTATCLMILSINNDIEELKKIGG